VTLGERQKSHAKADLGCPSFSLHLCLWWVVLSLRPPHALANTPGRERGPQAPDGPFFFFFVSSGKLGLLLTGRDPGVHRIDFVLVISTEPCPRNQIPPPRHFFFFTRPLAVVVCEQSKAASASSQRLSPHARAFLCLRLAGTFLIVTPASLPHQFLCRHLRFY
jgi:hypothetical protein